MKFSFFQNIIEKVFSPWSSVALLMSFIFLLVNHNLLIGNAAAIWDADGQFMPYQILIADYARQGKFLLWDIWSNGGIPTLGDTQMGVFSPINFLLGFFSGGSTFGFIILWLIYWWLGGLGILVLGKHFKIPVWGAFLVALQYLFSGLYITNAEHISWIAGFSSIPFIIWRLDVAVNGNRTLPAIQAGAIWGTAALSGYPGFTILTALFSGMWVLGRHFFSERNNSNNCDIQNLIGLSRSSIFSKLILIFYFLLIGTVILSPTYFSFIYEGVGTTTRVGTLSRETVISENPLHLGAISTFSSPLLSIQKLFNPNLWIGTDVSMTGIYAGIITFLALFAVLNQRKEKWRWWLLFLALVAIAFSMSQVFPFRGWLYDYFYPSRFFRHPSIFRAYYLFSITVLALFGVKDLFEILKNKSFSKSKNYKISSMLISSSAILVFVTVLNSLPVIGGKLYLAYFHIFVFWMGICLLPYFFTTKFFRIRQHIFAPVFLILLVIFDIFCSYRISKPVMMREDAGSVKRLEKLNQQHSTNLDLTSLGLYREENSCYEENLQCKGLNNDQMIKKIPVFNSYATQINNFQVEIAKNDVLRNMAIGTERIWFSTQVVSLPPTQENFLKFAEKANLTGKLVLIVHSLDEMLDLKSINESSKNFDYQTENASNNSEMKKIEVKLHKYTATELIFETVAPSNGWLLVTDRWARSWKAEVNNQSVEVFGGNFIFRAIPITKGNNHISFHYEPVGFPYLLIISWGGLFIILIISVLGLNK